MITINSLDEIKKYITEKKCNNVDDCNHITYTFQINNQLQDVEFNIDMNLNTEEQLESLSKEENLTMHSLIAKDIKFNVGCRLHKVIANNLQAKNICDIEQLEIQNNIKADVLSCEKVSASIIEANSLIVSKEINCKNIKVSKIVCNSFIDMP